LYNVTLGTLRKPLQYNLGKLEETLTIYDNITLETVRTLYNATLGTLREPLQYNLGKLEETLTI